MKVLTHDMAKTLDSWRFRQTSRGRYPWHLWTDGAIWQITRGQDFDVQPGTMRITILNRARTLGLAATTTVSGEHVIFQFIHPA